MYHTHPLVCELSSPIKRGIRDTRIHTTNWIRLATRHSVAFSFLVIEERCCGHEYPRHCTWPAPIFLLSFVVVLAFHRSACTDTHGELHESATHCSAKHTLFSYAKRGVFFYLQTVFFWNGWWDGGRTCLGQARHGLPLENTGGPATTVDCCCSCGLNVGFGVSPLVQYPPWVPRPTGHWLACMDARGWRWTKRGCIYMPSSSALAATDNIYYEEDAPASLIVAAVQGCDERPRLTMVG